MHDDETSIEALFDFFIVTASVKGPPLPLWEGQDFSWKEDVYEVKAGTWVKTGERLIRGRVVKRTGGRTPSYVIEVLEAEGSETASILNIRERSEQGFPLIERRERYLTRVLEYHDLVSTRLYKMKKEFATQHNVKEKNVKVVQHYQ